MQFYLPKIKIGQILYFGRDNLHRWRFVKRQDTKELTFIMGYNYAFFELVRRANLSRAHATLFNTSIIKKYNILLVKKPVIKVSCLPYLIRLLITFWCKKDEWPNFFDGGGGTRFDLQIFSYFTHYIAWAISTLILAWNLVINLIILFLIQKLGEEG